jgi:hypothetical protein
MGRQSLSALALNVLGEVGAMHWTRGCGSRMMAQAGSGMMARLLWAACAVSAVRARGIHGAGLFEGLDITLTR